MPHLSAIAISMCNVVHNWKQPIPTQSKSSCDNALVVWCLIWVPSQLQFTMSCTTENSWYLTNHPAVTRVVSLLSSCDAPPFECHYNYWKQPIPATSKIYQRRGQCQCSHHVMPHVSTVLTISMCNVVHNWKQPIAAQPKSSCEEKVSMLSSCDASFECHHNSDAQCPAQLKTADSTTTTILSQCSRPVMPHHLSANTNYNLQCRAQLKTADT